MITVFLPALLPLASLTSSRTALIRTVAYRPNNQSKGLRSSRRSRSDPPVFRRKTLILSRLHIRHGHDWSGSGFWLTNRPRFPLLRLLIFPAQPTLPRRGIRQSDVLQVAQHRWTPPHVPISKKPGLRSERRLVATSTVPGLDVQNAGRRTCLPARSPVT